MRCELPSFLPLPPPSFEMRMSPHAPPMLSPAQPPLFHSSTSPPIDFSPPLIAMLVLAAASFLLVSYSRLLSRLLFPPFRHFSLLFRPPSSLPPPPDSSSSSDAFLFYSPPPDGLDDSVIINLPLHLYIPPPLSTFDAFLDCPVCLLDFEDGDYIRTLPHCSHSFHADCIDIWLRSHPTCPLCRSGAFFPSPIMSSRIRPSFDDGILLHSSFLPPLPEQISGEIQEQRTAGLFSPERPTIQSEDHRCNRRELNMLLKRSHSFSIERSSFTAERVSLGAATTPHQRRRSMWMKSTPFSSIGKRRVFSFRTKSPGFFGRRGYMGMWERSSGSRRYNGGWSRRSGMRMGDPEALISPERIEAVG